jgi:quinol-cytochrome oxidoreductase complex cytochrome b subunit
MSIMIFAAMPYLDRSKLPGGSRFRPIYRASFYIFIVDVAVLSYVGAHPPGGVLVEVGRVATFIYFAIFLILPVVSKQEEKWLRARGLPAELQAMLASEKEKAGGET